MTRPRVTSNATEALGASISDSKYRLGRLEIASHVHRPDTFVPTGGVMPYAGTSSPSGWLLCYGQVVTIAAYSDLYGIIGATYNTGGEGAGNFRVPDLRGRVVAGVDNMGGSAASRLTSTTITGGADAPGEVGGTQTVGHTHDGAGSLKAAIGASGGDPLNISYISDSVPSGAPTTVTNYTVRGASFNQVTKTFNHYTPVYGVTSGASNERVVQPTMVMNYIIKT